MIMNVDFDSICWKVLMIQKIEKRSLEEKTLRIILTITDLRVGFRARPTHSVPRSLPVRCLTMLLNSLSHTFTYTDSIFSVRDESHLTAIAVQIQCTAFGSYVCVVKSYTGRQDMRI